MGTYPEFTLGENMDKNVWREYVVAMRGIKG